jgi:hypothetical protein
MVILHNTFGQQFAVVPILVPEERSLDFDS